MCPIRYTIILEPRPAPSPWARVQQPHWSRCGYASDQVSITIHNWFTSASTIATTHDPAKVHVLRRVMAARVTGVYIAVLGSSLRRGRTRSCHPAGVPVARQDRRTCTYRYGVRPGNGWTPVHAPSRDQTLNMSPLPPHTYTHPGPLTCTINISMWLQQLLPTLPWVCRGRD